MVTVLPVNDAMPTGLVVMDNITGKPEVADVLMVNGLTPYCLSGVFSRVMVWLILLTTNTALSLPV